MYIFIINIVLQLSIIPLYYYYNNNKEYYCACRKLPILFPLAKSSANLVAINTGLLLIGIMKFYRKYIYISIKYKIIHYILICNIFVWSLLHSIIHIINYNIINVSVFTNNTGITGLLLLFNFLLIIIGSLQVVRLKYFNYFILNHIIFVYIYIIIFYIHQIFCFTKVLFQKKKCPLLLSWIIITPPLILYIIESIYKYTIYVKTKIEKVSDTDIYKINIPLQKKNIGKIIWLCCPAINIYEFHSFAVCFENTVYFQIRGDWTKKLAEHTDTDLLVFGGIKVYSDNIIDKIQNNKTIIIVTGIGVTIFANILDILSKCNDMDLQIIIIAKSYKNVEWIIDSFILDILHIKGVNIKFYFTDTSIETNVLFRFNYYYNRPNIEYMINNIYLNTIIKKNTKINILYAGNKDLYKELKNNIKKYKQINIFNFDYF